MRTLLITLIAGLLSISAEAKGRANSMLNIRLTDYGNYTVTFNNTTYFATERVRIFNIAPGKHYLRIVETLQPRYRGSRAIGKRVIYEGYVTVPPHSSVFTRAGRGCGLEIARIDRFDHPGNGKKDHKWKDNDRRGNYDGYRGDDDDYRYDDYSYDYGNGGDNDDYDDGTWGESRLTGQKAQRTAQPAPAK